MVVKTSTKQKIIHQFELQYKNHCLRKNNGLGLLNSIYVYHPFLMLPASKALQSIIILLKRKNIVLRCKG